MLKCGVWIKGLFDVLMMFVDDDSDDESLLLVPALRLELHESEGVSNACDELLKFCVGTAACDNWL